VNYNGLRHAAAKNLIVHWTDSGTIEELQLCRDSRGKEVIMARQWESATRLSILRSRGVRHPWHLIHTRTGSQKLRNGWRCEVISASEARSLRHQQLWGSTFLPQWSSAVLPQWPEFGS